MKQLLTVKWAVVLWILLLPVCVGAQVDYASVSDIPDIREEEPDIKSLNRKIDQEQKDFQSFIRYFQIDANVKANVEFFMGRDIDALQTIITRMRKVSNSEKLKALNSIPFFVKGIRAELERKEFSVYRIPETLEKYKQILPLLLKDEPIQPLFREMDWRSTQVLSNSLFEYPVRQNLEDLASFKRMKSSPKFILTFLEKDPSFAFRDSLVAHYASLYPGELIHYLRTRDNELTRKIMKSPDPHVKQISSLSQHISATEIVPFTDQLISNEVTVDELVKKRKDVTAYYQYHVNTIIANSRTKGRKSPYQKALMNSLHEKTLSFYVKEINELHNSADPVRFANIRHLRPQDIYYVIISAEEEMYTSTYLGLYKRLMANFKDCSADSLFKLVNYDQFRKFLRLAANYNTLYDFFQKMPDEVTKSVIHSFVSEINFEGSDEEVVADVMDVADAFLSMSKDPKINDILKYELRSSLARSKKDNSFQGVRLYNILQLVYDAVMDKDMNDLAGLYNYEYIKVDKLKDKQGTINQLVLFYGDADGKASFKSFMALYKDEKQWKVEQNEQWVSISSVKGTPMVIYANLPLDNEAKKDYAAQDALAEYLKENNIIPSIVVHRGHSYHLSNTLKFLNSSTRIAILGSCGGYSNIMQIVSANSDIQIIASKQTGSMLVNDPLLNTINNSLLEGTDIYWEKLWASLDASFKNDQAQKLFSEYVPPYKNVGVFVYKLYNSDYY